MRRKAAYVKERRERWLTRAREALGGCCARCGTRERLEFDHVDRGSKVFKISQVVMRGWEAELAKCQLLCRECHLLKTKAERGSPLEPVHGSVRKYYLGCRCEPCRIAKHEQWRQWITRRRGTAPGPRRQPPGHGSRGRYNRGCRCDQCTAACTEYQRQRRERLRDAD